MARPNAVELVKWALLHAAGKVPGTYPIPFEQIGTDLWGYILGTSVVLCTEALIKAHRAYYDDWTDAAYYAAARKWLGLKVTDCQGIMDGYVRPLGITDTKAANAYASWCKTKGRDMAVAPFQLGMALYMANDEKDKETGATIYKDNTIHHVGIVCGFEPNGAPLVLEARGLAHGVVITRYKGRGWNRWGLMDAIFDYPPVTTTPAKPTLVLPCQLKVKTKGGTLNLRDAPNSDTGRVLCEMPNGAPVWAQELATGWYRLMYFDGKRYWPDGWASASYIG